MRIICEVLRSAGHIAGGAGTRRASALQAAYITGSAVTLGNLDKVTIGTFFNTCKSHTIVEVISVNRARLHALTTQRLIICTTHWARHASTRCRSGTGRTGYVSWFACPPVYNRHAYRAGGHAGGGGFVEVLRGIETVTCGACVGLSRAFGTGVITRKALVPGGIETCDAGVV